MRAILFATGHTPAMQGLVEARPAPMLPVLDRPFLQHVVEYLVDLGIVAFDFVLSEHPDQIETYFGDGKRWGCEIRYHLVRDAAVPYRVVQAMPAPEGSVLVAHCDRLPLLPEGALSGGVPASFDNAAGQSTGWAVIPGSVLGQLAAAADEAAAESTLRTVAGRSLPVAVLLSVRDYEGFLAAHHSMLDRSFPTLVLSGRQAEEQVWVSRNVSIHPSAVLTAPLFVGENCRVGENVHLGPYAVIGRNCVLDRQSTVKDSVILPGSYVGEALDLEQSIVDRNRLINVSLGAELNIGEDFLLGSIARGDTGARLAALAGRIVAAVLLFVLSPLVLLTIVMLALFRRPVFRRKAILRLPAAGDADRWQTAMLTTLTGDRPIQSGIGDFLLRFLPGLFSVALGRVRMVGVQPRTREEVEALPADWRALYLRSKAGLVTEAFIQYGAEPNEDDQYTCEAFYAVSAGFRLDVGILIRYAARVIGFGGSKSEPRASAAGGTT